MISLIYEKYKEQLFDIDFNDNNTTDIRVMLVTDVYSPNVETHSFYSDVTDELVASGYTAGGKLLVGRYTSYNATDNVLEYHADDIIWDTLVGIVNSAIIYLDTGVPTTSTLIAYINLNGNTTITGDGLELLWNTLGIINIK